jgi:TfoX/Sxy family transcriptional regulator of competence genes
MQDAQVPHPTMAHYPAFERRIADTLAALGARAEAKNMFGGVAFMINGNMSVGIVTSGELMTRFDGKRHAEVSEWPGAKPMTYGKPGMKGYLFVDANAVASAAALEKWVRLSLEFVNTLPAKRPAKKAAPRAKR